KKEVGDGFLIADRQHIGLEPTAVCQIDVVQLRHLLAPALQPTGELTLAQCQTVGQGITLYQADFLHGFTLRDSEQFNEWILVQANTLRRDLATALKRVSLVYQAQQNWDAALDYGHRWLNLDAWHEPAHCLLMQLYAETGQWTAVHNQYQALNDLLAKEIGATPQPETIALYQQLCQQRVQPTAVTPRSEQTPEQRSQWVLIQKVRRFWVKSVLAPLRAEQAYIHLKLHPIHQAVDHPWADVLTTQPTTAPANIYQAFRNAQRALLILGAPGAGKTVSLVELADYLLAMATEDAVQPIPVILNLSSWAGQQVEIASWAVEEMVAKYQIPRRMGRNWLKQDRLLLLFDGLDEMQPAYRAACVAALNRFRQEHGLADMVVCCRHEAYTEAANDEQLQLNGAVLIRPLTTAQIQEHTPPHLAASLFADADLLEMAQTPLTLNMMRSAYNRDGQTSEPMPATMSHLFETYVQRMCQRQAAKTADPLPTTAVSEHLSWLATQMESHNQSIFLIEQLQPSWLGNGRWLYLLLTRSLTTALLGTPIGWGFIALLQVNPPGIELHFLHEAAALLGVTAVPLDGILSIFLLVLVTGLVAATVDAAFFSWRQHRHDEAHINHKLGLFHALSVSGAVCLSATALFSLTDNWLLALSLGGMEAICFLLAFGYVNYGQSWQTEVRSRDAWQWSWLHALQFGLLGMVLSLVWSGIAWLQDPDSPRWLANLVNAALPFFLMGGVRGKRLEERNRPNEGIRIASRNGVQAALLLSLPTILLVSLTIDPISGLLTGMVYGTLAGSMHGFNDAIKHFLIRLLLWAEGKVPLRYDQLLNYAADALLLQKVGGGYTFHHRLLQDYFRNAFFSDNGLR
ncbi:MAG: hypothetical protein H6658_21415, partial [Ardenticatenaceae bacterium]|nr:hypothetical protein [Ardenticatenaceae bacterium]